MATTWKSDPEFEDGVLKDVEGNATDGWSVTRADGWGFFVPAYSPAEPKPGSTFRLWGKGIGSPFRGMMIDDQLVFYRTESEDKEYRDVELYGASAADWLKRWDEGRCVWSIEMGGLGPGYEQAIQVTAVEVLRHLLEAKYDASAWSDQDTWKRDREKIEEAGFANERIKTLGLSGAQWGAAVSLATKLYMDGPQEVMKHPDIQDRKIQVSNNFPVAA